MREAGYSPEGTPSPDATADPMAEPPPGSAFIPPLNLPGIGSVEQPQSSEWDVVATAEAPELHGDAYGFAALPDGSLIVDPSCDESLSPLADALEEHLQPPYRAAGMRRDDRLWTVCARQIEVARVTADGDELELSSVGGESTFTVDGMDADASLAPAELRELGEARGDDYAVHAARLDGDLWEVTADPL